MSLCAPAPGRVSPETGAPQGSILSPLLSNRYLHFVLDLWFTRSMSKKLQGEAYLFRFADDCVICFQSGSDARTVEEALKIRLGEFNLELAEEKTGLVGFGPHEASRARKEQRKTGSFESLGLRFICGRTRKGYFKVKRVTSGKRLHRSLKRSKAWLDANYATLRKGALIRGLARMVTGHL
ncbi:MAG: RNA-directed DNA polymerase [Kiritimatiellia bacterium]